MTTNNRQVITNVKSDMYGQIWGVCNGKRVKYTFSVNLWFYYETGEYIYNAIQE